MVSCLTPEESSNQNKLKILLVRPGAKAPGFFTIEDEIHLQSFFLQFQLLAEEQLRALLEGMRFFGNDKAVISSQPGG